MVQEREEAVKRVEGKQVEERGSLESLVSQAASVWDEVESALALQDQCSLQIRQLLDLIEEGNKLLRSSKDLIKSVPCSYIQQNNIQPFFKF